MNASDIAQTLADNGQSMTLTRISGGTFDPVAGGVTGAVTQTYTVHGITTRYKASDVNANNSLILTGDKKALLSPLDSNGSSITPLAGDTLSPMGVKWTIISVDGLSPQGVELMYTAQIRK